MLLLVALQRLASRLLRLVMIVMLILLLPLRTQQFKEIVLERTPLLEHGRLPMLVGMLPLRLVNLLR